MADSNGFPLPNGQYTSGSNRLPAEALDLIVDVADLGFATTAEVPPLEGVFGQDRASSALEVGLAIKHRGYNVYISGMDGGGRKEQVQQLLQKYAGRETPPADWIYVHNFDKPDRPLAISLPAGHGVKLRCSLEQLIETLQLQLPALLSGKEFDAERERLASQFGKQSETLFGELVEHARRLDLEVRRLPDGMLVFVPLEDGRPMEPAQIEALSAERKSELERCSAELNEHASELMARHRELVRQWHGNVHQIIENRVCRLIDPLFENLRRDYPQEKVSSWLERMHQHLLANLDAFAGRPAEEPGDFKATLQSMERQDPLLCYRVNVVVDNSPTQGAPVVVELCPTYKNLFGTIEHDVNLFGRVSTNFMSIKPGSLLRANGGYLIFDLADALTELMVWKQLKRTLQSGQLLTDIYEPFSLLSTSKLQPESIPLDTKTVVLGSAELYHMLQFMDEDFRELFKVKADFVPETMRNRESQQGYAQFISRQVRDEHLLPFDAGAVAQIIRQGARLAEHRDKLTLHLDPLADLTREASHWAQRDHAATVLERHVEQALNERVYRNSWLAEKIRQLIEEGILKISISGRCLGQINGLAVMDLGDYRFARPSRVTASVGVGREGLINIDRETDLSGSTHDKGVLILEGYLRDRYARRHPLALSASITFEQSYGWVEGDSASAAELFCLLSAIARVPLRQDVAVTGSVNQHGEIQAVGGVNEKVEGFYDVCRLQGLTGTQGVCLPRSNVPQLMLRRDVIESVREGKFHVWAIDRVEEGIELLTGLEPGDVDHEGSFHHRADRHFQEMLAILQEQPESDAGHPAHFALPTASRPVLPPLPGKNTTGR